MRWEKIGDMRGKMLLLPAVGDEWVLCGPGASPATEEQAMAVVLPDGGFPGHVSRGGYHWMARRDALPEMPSSKPRPVSIMARCPSPSWRDDDGQHGHGR